MHFLKWRTTEKVLPKDGLLLSDSGKNNRREQKTFSAD